MADTIQGKVRARQGNNDVSGESIVPKPAGNNDVTGGSIVLAGESIVPKPAGWVVVRPGGWICCEYADGAYVPTIYDDRPAAELAKADCAVLGCTVERVEIASERTP